MGASVVADTVVGSAVVVSVVAGTVVTVLSIAGGFIVPQPVKAAAIKMAAVRSKFLLWIFQQVR